MNAIAKIKEIIAEQLGLTTDEITAESKVRDDLGADSLDMVELVMELEEAFSLKIDEADMQIILTIQDIADYITSKA